MSLTQSQVANGTGSQDEQRLYDRQNDLGAYTPDPNNPYGIAGDPSKFGSWASSAGYGAGTAGAGKAYSGWNPTGFTDTAGAQRANAAAGWSEDDVAAYFAKLFGNQTPQSRVGGQMTGPQPAGAVAPAYVDPFANGGGANNAPVAPKATPQQAGENNSLMPGWSNGQPVVGTPAPPTSTPTPSAPSSGPATPLPGQTPTSPLNVALGGVTPMTPATLPTGGAAGEAPVTTGTPAAPGAAAGEAAAATNEPTASGQEKSTPKVPENPAQTWQWTMMSAAEQKAAWDQYLSDLTKWYQQNAKVPTGEPVAGMPVVSNADETTTHLQGTPSPADYFDNGMFHPGNLKPPSKLVTVAPGTVGQNDPAAKVMLTLVGEPYLIELVKDISRVIDGGNGEPSLDSMLAAGPTGAGNHWGNILTRLRGKIDYLNAVVPGLGWDPLAARTPQAPGTTTPGGTTPGGGTTGGGTGGAGVADASQFIPQAWAIIQKQYGPGINDPKNKPFLMEYAFSMAQWLAAQANQSNAVSGLQDSAAAFKNDPLRAKQVSMMSGIMDQPDNTPWDVVRNQAIAGSRQTADDASRQYALSAQRRLGTAGAGALPGVSTELARRQGNDLQTTLGQIEVDKAAKERAAQYAALQEADAVRQSTTGADFGMQGTIANALMGSPNPGANPTNGLGGTFVAIDTFYNAQNQRGSTAGDWTSGFASFLSGTNYDNTRIGGLGAGFRQQADQAASSFAGSKSGGASSAMMFA